MSTDGKSGRDTIVSQILQWLSGQPFNNILLIMIFLAIGWGMHDSVTIAIPSHLKQIQEGYKDVVEECQLRHQTERETTIRTYDRWIDIIQNNKTASTPKSSSSGTE